MQPFRMSALELIRAYRTRELSPVEAMASVLERVEAFEPHIHATWLHAPERALKEARASEARWAKGEPIGPLDGVPVTVKDNIATRGEPTPVGTAASEMAPAKADAPPAARLREAGAIIFTKTTMPDYGMLSSGLSSHHALARNPWKLDRNPGGSSAGAGAAAAALYGPLHLGTDIGGSVRLPAGWCGIFGLKPSAGRVPIDPPYIGRVAGPMTRDAADAALMMATLSLPDVRDYSCLKYEELDWAVEPASLKGLRIGLMLEAGCGVPPKAQVRAAVERAARDFEAAGARIEPLEPFLTQEMLDGVDHFWRTRALIDINALEPERRAAVLPFIRDWAESADGFSGQHVFRGFSQIPAMRKAAIDATSRLRLRAFADRADDRLSGGMAFAQPRSPQSPAANRFHRALQHVRAAGGVGQLRLRRRGPADRAADRRAPVRRPRRAGRRPRLRGDAGGREEAVARAAGGLRRPQFCVRAGLFSDLGAFFWNSESMINRND